PQRERVGPAVGTDLPFLCDAGGYSPRLVEGGKSLADVPQHPLRFVSAGLLRIQGIGLCAETAQQDRGALGSNAGRAVARMTRAAAKSRESKQDDEGRAGGAAHH